MPDTTLRQITMLRLIPRRPPGRTTFEIKSKLEELGYSIDLRSVQRDLVRLSSDFPLSSDESKPARWYYDASAEVSLPGHDPYSALTWLLAGEHLQPLLPRSVLREIEPRFREARKFLKASSPSRLRNWTKKVRIVPRGLTLQTPDVQGEILDVLYEGLMESSQIEVQYRRRGDGKINTFRIHPQAIVLRDGLIYLLATVDDYTDLRQLVAHRIRSARPLHRPARKVENFDLDSYIREGGFDYAHGHEIDLVIHVEHNAARHLMECPITAGQEHRELEDGRVEFRVRAQDSMQLRWWLLGYGDCIEVIEPSALRSYMAGQARAMMESYACQKN